MSEDSCPGCGRQQFNKLEIFPRVEGKKKRMSAGAKICRSCNLIIPFDRTLKFWNGKEAVEVC